jgi:PTH1 family peptidyl-tRNA hydrolase
MERALVVGLRNPGVKYEGTRHNVGAEVVATLADRLGASFKRARLSIRAEVAEARIGDHPVALALPQSFMNESGQSVAPLARYYRVAPERLVVVHDDIDLPFAKLRVQFGRGAGGNNGVRSVIGSLGTQDFWRLKCGVGRPPGSMDPADYVLRRFSSAERPEADLMVQYGCDVIEEFVAVGGEAASQRAGDAGTGSEGRPRPD